MKFLCASARVGVSEVELFGVWNVGMFCLLWLSLFHLTIGTARQWEVEFSSEV